MTFHAQGRTQFCNMLSSCHLLWHHFQAGFCTGVHSLKNCILGSIQRKPQGKHMRKYHHFLNTTQKIRGNDRGTHDVIIQNIKTSTYTWNSARIDGTDIFRSFVVVRKEFRSTLDL